MPRRSRQSLRPLELALAAPAVITMRMARMPSRGKLATPAQRREMTRMVNEKRSAFSESWLAMAARAQQVQLQWWMSAAQAWWTPWLGMSRRSPFTAVSPKALTRRLQNAQMSVLAHGLAPIHRTATANLRRLAKPGSR